MGVFIFFSISAVVIILGLGMTVLTIRHHWQQSRYARLGNPITESSSKEQV